MSGMRRPYRSAIKPKMNAPIGRKAKVIVIDRAIALSLWPNSLPIAVRTNVTMKKSKASSVQPRKLAMTADRWSLAAVPPVFFSSGTDVIKSRVLLGNALPLYVEVAVMVDANSGLAVGRCTHEIRLLHFLHHLVVHIEMHRILRDVDLQRVRRMA